MINMNKMMISATYICPIRGLAELEHIGLLDRHLEPKEHVEAWLGALLSTELGEKIEDFIDISRDEYFANPNMHLTRLWEHFKESWEYHTAVGSGHCPAQRREKGTMFLL